MSKPVVLMTVDEVSAFLASIKMQKYSALFVEKDIDGATLAQLDKVQTQHDPAC